MKVDEEHKGTIKEPEKMVRYKPSNELYTTLNTCMYLRELPEITPEESLAIQTKERQGENR